MWQLKQINPTDGAELQAAWLLARDGLEEVRRKAKASWLAEQVFAAIVAGRATLHIGYLHGEYAGAVVLAQNVDPFNGEKSLLVWALYTCAREALYRGLEDVKAIARQHGIGKIIFHSPRRGWERRMKQIGFHVKERIFEASVPLGNGG